MYCWAFNLNFSEYFSVLSICIYCESICFSVPAKSQSFHICLTFVLTDQNNYTSTYLTEMAAGVELIVEGKEAHCVYSNIWAVQCECPVMCRIILVVLSAAKWGRMIISLVSTMKLQLSCGDTLCLQLGQLMCM